MKRLIALLMALVMIFGSVQTVSAANFTDVASGAYYEEAVNWAVEKGVTAGTSATTFSPDKACTRAEVVTFLWRAMGKPAPVSQSLPFSDVSADVYYTQPVLWAVEKGVTAGTSATTFSPNKACTRAEVVTFLWRAMGKPVPGSQKIPFSDVSASAYYIQPVLWAVEKGITSGTSATTFSPDTICSRGQIVTFLYRCMKDSENTGGGEEDAEKPLTISQHPEHKYIVADDEKVAFSVQVTGGKAPYTYRWQERLAGGRGTTFEDIVPGSRGYNGYTGAYLEVDPAMAGNLYGRSYRCIITDANGEKLISNYGTVYRNLKITSQPTNYECAYNGYATFSVTVEGGSTPYTYEWQCTNTSGYWTTVANRFPDAENTNTASVRILIDDRNVFNNTKFRCLIKDDNGKSIVTDTVTVKEKLTVVGIHSDYWNSNGTVAKNQNNLRVNVSGGSGSYTYAWYYKNVPQGDYASDYSYHPLSNTGSSLSYSSRRNYYIHIKCVVTDSAGASAETSFILQYSPY